MTEESEIPEIQNNEHQRNIEPVSAFRTILPQVNTRKIISIYFLNIFHDSILRL